MPVLSLRKINRTESGKIISFESGKNIRTESDKIIRTESDKIISFESDKIISPMTNKVIIQDLKLYAYHGVMPQERKVGAYFTIDATIDTDFSRAMTTDELEGTISYADVFDIIKREMSVPSKLLEHAAGRIAQAIMTECPSAQAVSIRLIKENPPMGADCQGAGVEISVKRS